MSNADPQPKAKQSSIETPKPTCVRLLTARTPAAIAVIQLQGAKSQELINLFWKPATGIRRVVINTIRYGTWMPDGIESRNPGDKQASEDIVLCWTKDDCVEIHCHGGPVAANRIISDLVRHGVIESVGANMEQLIAVEGKAKRWTEDAWQDLPKATTELTTAILLAQTTGLLEKAMTSIYEQIAVSDFGAARNAMDELKSRSIYGTRLLDGWRVAIVGPPNAGKSSFLNKILGFTRAIVHHQPGTTRDVLRERTTLEGWPIELIDTAGLRETDCRVEAEGVRRAMDVLREADLILLLVEPVEGLVVLHKQIIDEYKSKVMVVVTKADLFLNESKVAKIQAALDPSLQVVAISSAMNTGMAELSKAIIDRLVPCKITKGQAVPFRREHVLTIQDLQESLLKTDNQS
ncbi:MAG: 50S ribosome-binding GTPase [Planctomycetota bacterium]|nr:50S ribosome-binding GTPase [Planctomycetota bacterium]